MTPDFDSSASMSGSGAGAPAAPETPIAGAAEPGPVNPSRAAMQLHRIDPAANPAPERAL